MAIVVLSTNYGSSTWCLNELVKIMERKNNSGFIVFPIFYHVNPSDVRKQQNSFFEHFSNHEVNFKDDILKVASWRKALKEVADLSGNDIRGENEASCIKEIADKILMQLPVKASEFRKSVVGIESRILKIKEMMDSKNNEVLFIGLWGMGGIGKTTTAIAIFEDCKNEFQGSCFLKDVRQIKDRMHDLQKKLLSSVLDTKFEDIYNVAQGSSIIQERLQFKKVLLVIDDVDDVEQLDALARHCGWFGRGSRIIITTRDAHLLNNHIAKYDVPTLPLNEAIQLFCFHAFKDDHPHEDFEELSFQVLKYAAGLPLALRVLGCHLFNGKKYFWEAALKKLKEISTEKIISTLKISFDGLDDFQKDIFLDIACFFRGCSKQVVEERLEILGLYPKEGIDVLIQKSLINVIADRIGMHDLLQEMGWYIVRQRSNWDVTKYSHIWLQKDLEYVLSNIKESMSNMLRKRNKHFEVKVPGRQIPSWLQYKMSGHSVSIFLPPLYEWYTDKFKGFVLSGINGCSTSGYLHFHCDGCCPGEVDVLVMCIPIDNIREAMHYREGEKERTLFEISSSPWLDETNEFPRWGLSLVYSEGEVIELDPHKVMIVIDNNPYEKSTFRVNIAESRDVIEDLYRFKNPISWASFQQQTHSQAGTSAMAQDLSAPDLSCFQEGEPSRISYGKDGDSELDLRLSLNSHMMM